MILKRLTVLSALEVIFRQIYGESEAKEILSFLENKIAKSPESELIYEKIYDGNDEEVAKGLLENILQEICQSKPSSVKQHNPHSMMGLAQKFFFIGDRRIACELIWGSASLALRTISSGIGIEISSHEGQIRLASDLSAEIGEKIMLFQYCHSSFYHNKMDGQEISAALKSLGKFLEIISGLWLSDDRIKELVAQKHRFK